MPFRKMNGLGNDFVVLDLRERSDRVSAAEARAIADRATGVGCDQLIVLEPSRAGADVFMRIFNPDGSEAGACGNATRCVGRLVMDEAGTLSATIETRAGLLAASDAGAWNRVTADMGRPRFGWRDIPLARAFEDTRFLELSVGPIDAPLLHSPSAVNIGNPHCVFFVDDLAVVDLAKVGPMLEHHPLFPEAANVSLARVESRAEIRVRVWERGAGLTRACGSAACAVAVAAARRRLAPRAVAVHMPGGTLDVEWREADDRVAMTGAIELDFTGELAPDLFVRTPAIDEIGARA
jgi:diaminopimelate epimerase